MTENGINLRPINVQPKEEGYEINSNTIFIGLKIVFSINGDEFVEFCIEGESFYLSTTNEKILIANKSRDAEYQMGLKKGLEKTLFFTVDDDGEYCYLRLQVELLQ